MSPVQEPALKVALAMGSDVAARIFPPSRLADLGPGLELLSTEVLTSFDTPLAAELLPQVDILLTGWGAPLLTAEVLDQAPKLRYALHAAGSVKEHITDAVWERGIQVTTAAEANSIPVAEYTLAMILLANKRVLQLADHLQATRAWVEPENLFPAMGNFGQTVGLVGASRIGRRVIELLAPFDFSVVVSDPFLSNEEAAGLGVRLVDLEELVAISDVVSLHAPDLPETFHLLNEELINALRPGATFINTSRGALVDQEALARRVGRGDLFAVLDVTTPWLLDPGHPLYGHPNVLLTPHIAGSLGVELDRLASYALAEARRAAAGQPLRYPVTAGQLARSA
ncbi:hydroxyacid dehydrogenase [Arthrobacter sp. 35W]|uniref:hydroxyacid dehydrogenase n=1 Tax=Arthrobacter sp. 35W TaxID=1132441 RepID=UPI00047D79AF|nr:hydroxyacid dehydrogenase [Arthrobacter sp. 35W]